MRMKPFFLLLQLHIKTVKDNHSHRVLGLKLGTGVGLNCVVCKQLGIPKFSNWLEKQFFPLSYLL